MICACISFCLFSISRRTINYWNTAGKIKIHKLAVVTPKRRDNWNMQVHENKV
jgi:hypothetical protein